VGSISNPIRGARINKKAQKHTKNTQPNQSDQLKLWVLASFTPCSMGALPEMLVAPPSGSFLGISAGEN
jgi:hypothetical protein